MALPSDLQQRWRTSVVLKRDVFSTVERGFLRTDDGEVEAVLRRLDEIPWWSRPIAHHLFNRERRALATAGTLGIAPPLLYAGRNVLVRGWIDGVALHIAKPTGNIDYFRSAKAALRKLHQSGLCHNDLAKQQNWLFGADGRAYLTDFQLATRFRPDGRLFRVAAYEDLRHLLKHKRHYVPAALTPAEKRVLARKSIFTRIWMATGKKVYVLITRGVFRFTDREGGGPRLVNDAPRLATTLKTHPAVKDVAIVAFPDRRSGTGLYAFVESDGGVTDSDLKDFVMREAAPVKPPEHLQVVETLPRGANGEPRTEVLQLIAMNQLDLISQLLKSDAEKAVVDRILDDRRNLRDRYSF